MNRKQHTHFYSRFLVLILIICLFNSCGERTTRERKNTSSKTQPVRLIQPTYNVFIENSMSMDGYLSPPNSEFKSALQDLLSDIELPTNKVCRNLRVNYINEKVIPNINFGDGITIQDFQKKGGARSTTSFDHIFKEVLNHVDSNNVAILVSDMVLSPGKRPANHFLSSQKNSIKRIFGNKLAQISNLECIILKMNSSFNGMYYTYKGDKKRLKSVKRPYYITFLGYKSHLNKLKEVIKLSDRDRKPDHTFTFVNSSESFIWTNEGRNWDRYDNTIKYFTNRDLKKKSGFSFSILVDLKNMGIHKEYLENRANYYVSDSRFELEISEGRKRGESNYSHTLTLTTKNKDIQRGDPIFLALKRETPNWVVTTHSEDDTSIVQNKKELDKTYGFRYLLQGIEEAYKSANNNSDYFFKIDFTLDKR